MNPSKLIILRGPSGSGKSTVARELFKNASPKTALIEQDHYRFIFKPAGGGSKLNSDTIRRMIKHNTLTALGDGYNVILEGILSLRAYGEVLSEIFERHPHENHLFYFDVSLEEALRRHTTRPEQAGFGEAEMREWYEVGACRYGREPERVIPEDSSLEQTLRFIKKVSGI